MLWRIAGAALGFTALVLSLLPAQAQDYPSAKCIPNGNQSHLTMVAGNPSGQRFACTATCQYTVTGQRPLQTFACTFNLAPRAAERVVCDLPGSGPGHFDDVHPTKFVCQPR